MTPLTLFIESFLVWACGTCKRRRKRCGRPEEDHFKRRTKPTPKGYPKTYKEWFEMKDRTFIPESVDKVWQTQQAKIEKTKGKMKEMVEVVEVETECEGSEAREVTTPSRSMRSARPLPSGTGY